MTVGARARYLTSMNTTPAPSDPIKQNLTAADYVVSSKVEEEISRAKPEDISIDVAFERETRFVRVLKDLENEVGGGGHIFADSINVRLLREEGLSPKDKDVKAELDGNRENARKYIFGGKGEIYSNSSALRYLTVFSADNSKAVTLCYQRIDGWPSGNMSSNVSKIVSEGEQCSSMRQFFDCQGERKGARLQDVVDLAAEEKITICSRPDFPREMTKQELEQAIQRSEMAGSEAKARLLPMVSEQAREKLEDPSHPINSKDSKWVFADGRASKVSLDETTNHLVDKIRHGAGATNSPQAISRASTTIAKNKNSANVEIR